PSGPSARTGGALLTSIEIPNSVTSIGYGALGGCASLTSIEIPNSVTSIGGGLLSGCASLKSFTLPETLTTIPSYMFRCCTGLKEIIIPNTVKQIESFAFSGWTEDGYNMTTTYVSIPGSIEKFGENIFNVSPDINTVVYDTDSPVEAPANMFDEEIYSQATLYTDCSAEKLAGVSPWNKFLSVKPMNELPTDDILTYSFDEATKTCTVTGYNRTPVYGEDGDIIEYKGIEGELVIPSKKGIYTVTAIKIDAFKNCKGLTAVYIPETITSIGGDGSGYGAFYNCYNLTKVEYASLESLCQIDFGTSTFSYDYSLWIDGKEVTEITLPESMTEIKNYTFLHCSNLKSVTIPNTVTKIGNGAFLSCSGLKSIEIPESVTSLADNCFRESGLTSIAIPESVKEFGKHVFAFCRSLESFTLPETLNKIAFCMFRCCTGLKEIVIPNTVKHIDQLAFSGKYETDMTVSRVTLPGSIESLGQNVFQLCTDINTVVYDTDSPVEAPANIFDEEIYSQATLYTDCPAVKLAGVSPWNKFLSVKPMNELPDFSGIEVMPEDADMPVEIYTLTGVRVKADASTLAPGIYIERRGSTTRKIAIR
ncbi:MAG: leucine-rich repeat domain-containing protein, partial [Duncaniella sp.]|nr:leucine-rich repeat domain-containing protein [Duncaniella sp.]